MLVYDYCFHKEYLQWYLHYKSLTVHLCLSASFIFLIAVMIWCQKWKKDFGSDNDLIFIKKLITSYKTSRQIKTVCWMGLEPRPLLFAGKHILRYRGKFRLETSPRLWLSHVSTVFFLLEVLILQVSQEHLCEVWRWGNSGSKGETAGHEACPCNSDGRVLARVRQRF